MSTIICSIDKDLLTVPGYHYHLDNQTLTYITPFQALKNFYTQMLVGDSSDNVRGIDGVGAVGAKKILKDCLTEEQMYTAVYNEYQMQDGPNGEARMLLNSRLLWILQKDRKNPVEERLG